MAIILLSLLGVVLSVVIGTVWYSGGTPMGRLHMKYLGFDTLSKEEQKKKMDEGKAMMPKMYAAQMFLSLLLSVGTVFIVQTSVQNGVPLLMALLFIVINWLCFAVPMVGTGILWGTCDRKIAWKKFFSDSLSPLVTLLILGIITGLVS